MQAASQRVQDRIINDEEPNDDGLHNREDAPVIQAPADAIDNPAIDENNSALSIGLGTGFENFGVSADMLNGTVTSNAPAILPVDNDPPILTEIDAPDSRPTGVPSMLEPAEDEEIMLS